MMQCVQVKLELGHKAAIRAKPTAEGFTHDWTVFVRGPEGSNIQHFVEKVVFFLHESFPKPKRVVKEPPYQVSESGYACFCLPVEVYFKNREEPKKVKFDYDLVLHLEGPPINHIRCEKLTFQNPTEDFRRKLIKAGGVGILDPEGGTILGQHVETLPDVPPSLPPPPKAKSSPDAVGVKKHKSKDSTPKSSSSHISPAQEPFVELFGQPIKTSKSSPDPKKLKETVKPPKNVGAGSASLTTTSMTVQSISSTVRDGKFTSKGKDKRPYGSESSGKVRPKKPPSPPEPPPVPPPPEIKVEPKVAKRPQTPPGSPSDCKKEIKKRKRNTSQSSKAPRDKHADKRKKSKEEGDKNPVPKSASSSSNSNSSSSSNGERSYSSKKPSDAEAKHKSVADAGTKDSHKKSAIKEKAKVTETIAVMEKVKAEPKPSPNLSSPDDSPESSISFSSLQISGKRGPLGALMAELDDQDDDDELLSPLSSSDPPSPPRFTQHDDSPPKIPDRPPSTKPQRRKAEKQAKKSESKSLPLPAKNATTTEELPAKETTTTAADREMSKLIALQQQIMSTEDCDSLQKIVDILEDTGNFEVTSETFDFDLCTLDTETLQRIQSCLVPAF